MERAIPRLVIAGVGSGAGKTTATVGLARALAARGLRVGIFKCGPDYLDPTYHTRATHRPSHNLDGWMMGKRAVLATFVRASADLDIALIEGVMGLFDGASPTSDEGSTAEIAKWLSAPVILLADTSGMARSFAALVAGFATFDPELPLEGVIANRVGSRSHLDLLRKALPTGAPPLFGGLPKSPAIEFPARHLGLRTADRAAVPEAHFDAWGATVAEWWNVDGLLALARSAPPVESFAADTQVADKPRCRIGIAFDEAFHFYYEDNLRRLEEAGATLVRFSPLHDQRVPDVDGLYFGGGYPELHAEALSRNAELRGDLHRVSAMGLPIYGECGGLMYLSEAIRTRDGRSYPMAGLLSGEAVMGDKLEALGYVEVETQARTCFGDAGLRYRGHQFRYSRLTGADHLAGSLSVRKRRGGETSAEGYQLMNVLGTYVHAHWASNALLAPGFVRACALARSHISKPRAR